MIYDLVNDITKQSENQHKQPTLNLSDFLWDANDAKTASELLSALAAEKTDKRLRLDWSDIVSLAGFGGKTYLIDNETNLWSLKDGVLSVHSIGYLGSGDDGHVLDLVQDKDIYTENKEYFDNFLSDDYIAELCETYGIN